MENSSLSMGSGGVISEVNPSLSGAISSGKSYDEAFSILENRANNIVTGWRFLTDGQGGDTNISFRIQNGAMYLNLPSQELSMTVSRVGGVVLLLGEFPSDVVNKINSMFSSLNMATYNKFNLGGISNPDFIPYGEFGTFPIFSPYQEANEETTTLERYPRYGFAKISLIASYVNNLFSSVGIGMYVDHFIEFSSDGKVTFNEGPVNWLSLQLPTAVVHVPRIFGVIPLPGKF